MKRLTAIVVTLALILSDKAFGARVDSLQYHINTNKVVTIAGVIDSDMTSSVYIQLHATETMRGDRLVLIRSPGGSVNEGKKILNMLLQERKDTGKKLVCMVIDAAHSMAFNILTHCDVRLASSNSTMVVHKVALGGDPGIRMTARNLRLIAKEMEEMDEYWARTNAEAMHISRKEYDDNADNERRWTAQELVSMKYLNGIAIVGS